MSGRRFSGQVFLGAVILVVGVLALLNSLDIANVSGFWRWIPMLFILFGVWQLVVSRGRHWAGPVILIVIAAVFLLAALGVLRWSIIGQAIFPIILIVLGLRILLRRTGLRGGEAIAEGTGTVSAISVFSGTKRRVTSQDFRGGEITALFGGAELDLREAGLETRPATVNVMVAFGGAEIRVPSDWSVQMDVLVLFGASEDKRRETVAASGGETFDLVVTGLVLFGGLEIKD